MDNLVYVCWSTFATNDEFDPSDLTPKGDVTWMELFEDNLFFTKEKFDFIKNKQFKIVRENKGYYLKFNDDRDFLHYVLKYGDNISK